MAKATKVSSDDESVHNSDSDSDDDEPTKDELITMLEYCTHHYKETRKVCKALLKDKKTLEQELDELRASYESLNEDHKKLQKAHIKLEEAHSSLVNKCENEPTKMEKAKTCNIGLTCDILSSGGVELVIGDCSEPHQVTCEGFLSLPRGRSQLATLVDCSWLGGSPSYEWMCGTR